VQEAVSALGSDVFLRLLVTQLQNQDPTNPTQNEDFVAQLAQFSTLEQTTSTNDLLEQLISQNVQRTQFDLDNLIGRTVVSEGDTVSLGETDQPILAYALSDTASRVTIDVLGKNGQILRSIQSESPGTAGAHQVQWDGLDEDGDRLPEGVYQFIVKAVNGNQEPVSNFTFARERVSNIIFGTEKPVVLQSGKTLNTQDIISIQ
jgi:flagellar basal-body rod modification protein FlgD